MSEVKVFRFCIDFFEVTEMSVDLWLHCPVFSLETLVEPISE